MIEIDGPPHAWFETPDGEKFMYVVYAIKGPTFYDVAQCYAKWRNSYDELGKVLVWRKRPEFVEDDDGYWKVVCRCVKVPIVDTPFMLYDKPEGTGITTINP